MCPVSDRDAMIAGMSPALDAKTYVFASVEDEELLPRAIAMIREAEGLSLILPLETAAELGLPVDLPMRRIILNVHSALDGVGLTAAVSATLAGLGIPCNVVAGFHHDHVFVPADRADEALGALRARAAVGREG
ncbi:MAG: ACT domain-containing protein [Rhodobacteraceae bacterium]|nr:ACT domain-containing protein [Paracoccaceae bacterium]